MLHFILFLLLANIFSTIENPERPTNLRASHRKSFAALVFLNNTNISPSEKTSCQWIKKLKHQSKFCWKRRGVAEVLLKAKNLSVWNCETQFKFDQWNCSRREFFFKNFYRETAFMYSLVSSAVMFSAVQACSDKTFPNCKCGNKSPKEAQTNSSKWRWGGCNDNVKFAKKFTRKFFQLKKKVDGFNELANYNTEIGIKTVIEAYENSRVCNCHGLSTSCTFEVCWKKLPQFEVIVQKLKDLYYHAKQLQPENTIGRFRKLKKKHVLLYLEKTPNFCPLTAGRECFDKENCATLCCGKVPYIIENIIRSNRCQCSLNQQNYTLKCETCYQKKLIYKCP